MSSLLDNALQAHELGWKLIALSPKSKIPIVGSKWATSDRQTEADIECWVDSGLNIGLVLGEPSGDIIVIDQDVPDAVMNLLPKLPNTVTVESSPGHLHFLLKDVRGGTRSRPKKSFLPGIDLKANGGYVVLAGSAHPDGGTYEYQPALGLDDIKIADCPDFVYEIIAKTRNGIPRPKERHAAYDGPKSRVWADVGIKAEIEAFPANAEHGRNDASYMLGLKCGSLLYHYEDNYASERLEEIIQVAIAAPQGDHPFPEREARTAVLNGVGNSKPRGPKPKAAPVLQNPGVILPDPASEKDRTEVFTPGKHVIDGEKGDEWFKVSETQFIAATWGAVPKETLFAMNGEAGVIKDGEFAPFPNEVDSRIFASRYAEPVSGVKPKQTQASKNAGEPSPAPVITPRQGGFGADNGKILLAGAPREAEPLFLTTRHPVLLPSGALVTEPGYTEGVWHEGTPIDITTDPREIRRRLHDIVGEFPFMTGGHGEADYHAMVVTSIIRPSLRVSPMFVVTADHPGIGKTKLVDEIMGNILQGGTIAPSSLPEDEDKALTFLFSAAKSGQSILFLDNNNGHMESQKLASFISSDAIVDRGFYTQNLVKASYRATIITSGNDVTVDDELHRRCVWIDLAKSQLVDADRLRYNPDKGQDVAQVALKRRASLLGAYLGMVKLWLDAGQPSGAPRPGVLRGFEQWKLAVGGIMECAGMGKEFLSSWDPTPRSKVKKGVDPNEETLRIAVFGALVGHDGPLKIEEILNRARGLGLPIPTQLRPRQVSHILSRWFQKDVVSDGSNVAKLLGGVGLTKRRAAGGVVFTLAYRGSQKKASL